MPKMVCQTCLVELKIETNGVYVIEYFGDPPTPYKLWSADHWICPHCGDGVITGFGYAPLAEHHEKDFNERLEKLRADPTNVVINDYEYRHGRVQK